MDTVFSEQLLTAIEQGMAAAFERSTALCVSEMHRMFDRCTRRSEAEYEARRYGIADEVKKGNEESESRVGKSDAFLDVDINEEPSYSMLKATEMEEDENSLVFHAKGSHFATRDEFESFPFARWPSLEVSEAEERAASLMEEHSDDGADDVAFEEAAQANNENEADVSIGTEIPDLDITDEIEIQDSIQVLECTHEDPSTISVNLCQEDDHGLRKVEEQVVELQSLSVPDREHMREKDQEIVSRDKGDRRDFEQISNLAKRMGLYCELYGEVVVASKVPLPNYRSDLDAKRPQREVVIPLSLQRRVEGLLQEHLDRAILKAAKAGQSKAILALSNIRVLGTRLSKEGSIVMTRTEDGRALGAPGERRGIG